MSLLNGTQFRKVAALGLAAIIGLSSTVAVSAQTVRQQQAGAPLQARQQQLRPGQARQVATRKPVRRDCPDLSRQDLVVVMPNAGADNDEMNKELEEVHGTVVGSIGKGPLKVMIVKAEKGKALELQSKLGKDKKNFRAINVNRVETSDYVPTDPTVAQSWHLPTLRVYDAWDLLKAANKPSFGHYNAIAVMDSGCSWQGDTGVHNWGADVTGVHRDIASKLEDEMDGFLGTGLFGDDVEDLGKEIEQWGNRAHTLSMGTTDTNGHGTWVAATAAGNENGKCSVGISPGTGIYPIKIADGPFNTKIYTDDISLISGMICAIESRCPIVNISYSGMNDVDAHPVLHELFRYYYFNKNGLIFNSAGNKGTHMSYKDLNYINTVSAVRQVSPRDIYFGKPALQLVNKTQDGWGSNTGRCVDFCAPGIDIPVANPDGTQNTVGGTSFSAPICAGIAALILKANPKLKNSQVQNIMIHSCTAEDGGRADGTRSEKFGFGQPDAYLAVKEALRS